MKIAESVKTEKQQLLARLDTEFNQWRPDLEEVARFLLPRRYVWTTTTGYTGISSAGGLAVANMPAATAARSRQSVILDPTATIAARTLANGWMNGCTSPARPWFGVRTPDFGDELESYPKPHQVWLEEVARRMHIVFGESNFYTAMSMLYLELVGFGTGVVLVYEDFDEIIRCYNSPMGEYRLIQDNRKMVMGVGRCFPMTVGQVVKEFGLENVSANVRDAWKAGQHRHMDSLLISHLIEENTQGTAGEISRKFKFREFYWETQNSEPTVCLRIGGFSEKPFMAPRWDLLSNDTYGTSPSMDALPEIKQLQLETKQKGQAVDKLIKPPIVADAMLRSNPMSLLPGGVTYVPSSSQVGAKPLYTVNPPLQAMTEDIREIQIRIKQIYFNDLFRNISSLDTVRSAAEIYERKSEDLLQLGAIYSRFENEALNPAILRVFGIMRRKNLLPEPPPGLDVGSIKIHYTSLFAEAQRAATTGSIERWMQVIGQMGAAVPEVLRIPDYNALLRVYARRLSVPAVVLRSPEEVQAELAQEKQLVQAQQGALVGNELTQAARNLSQTDVGGGQTALAAMLGG